MEALGRNYNIVPVADGVYVNADAGTVEFVCNGADTYTITEATDAAGTGAQNLAVVDHYYANTSAGGAAAWTREDQAVGAAVTLAAGAAVVAVSTKALSDGFTHLACTSTATGLVTAVTSDLTVQRDPVNLPAVAA